MIPISFSEGKIKDESRRWQREMDLVLFAAGLLSFTFVCVDGRTELFKLVPSGKGQEDRKSSFLFGVEGDSSDSSISFQIPKRVAALPAEQKGSFCILCLETSKSSGTNPA